MLRVKKYGDVTRFQMASPGSVAARLHVSAYVLRGVMIDTGFHLARQALLAAVESTGVRGAIVTHWHEDHAGNVVALAARGLPIAARRDTADILRARPAIRLYRRLVWGRPPALVRELEPFDLDGLECLHTPGHSTDHQVVWDARTGTLFSGDLWLGVRARILHRTEDPYQIVGSLRRVEALSPERMFDAHRGFVENPTDAIHAKIDWLGSTMETIAERIRTGWSDGEIVRRVLGGEELAAYVSGGEYSRRNLVRAVRAARTS